MMEEGLEGMWSSAVSPKLQQEHRVPLLTAAARSDLTSARGSALVSAAYTSIVVLVYFL